MQWKDYFSGNQQIHMQCLVFFPGPFRSDCVKGGIAVIIN